MKAFKRSMVALLSCMMAVVSSTTTAAFAANAINDVDESLVVEELSTTSTSKVDNTFIMGSYHRGGDRTYPTSELYVRAVVTDVNGNSVDNNVVISLSDYNGNETLWNVPSGGMSARTFSIVPGRMYYFEYYRNGTARDLKIHMIIESV